MKNLKRVLSLGLASVMLLGMMVMGASAKDFTDAADIEHSEAVQILVALNVINGMEDGSTFAPKGNVTRGQMAKMIAIIKQGGNDVNTGVKAVPSFTDIAGNWAEPYIEYCADMGIISGRGDGTFDPEGNVTGYEVTKMALTTLGYDAKAYKLEGASWAAQTDELARKSTPVLYRELGNDVVLNAPATRDTAAQILWNALENKTRTVNPEKNTNDSEVTWGYIEGKKTLLEERYQATTYTGRFVGNHDFMGSGAKGEITVGSYSFPSDLSIDFIGEEVKVVYKDGAKGTAGQPDAKDDIFGVFVTGATRVINSQLSKVKSLYSKDHAINIDGTVYNVADTNTNNKKGPVLQVYTNFVKTPTKYTDAQLEGKPTENGVEGTNSALTTALAKQSSDTIKVTFNDDNEIDNIYLTENYVSVVTAVNSAKITLDSFGSLNFADHDVEDGLKVGDIVIVTPRYGTTKLKTDGIVTVKKAEKVAGEVVSYTDNNGITLDNGKTYKISYKNGDAKQDATRPLLQSDPTGKIDGTVINDVKAANEKTNPLIGEDVELYLSNGYVMAIVKTSESASNYSVVTEVKKNVDETGGVFSSLQLQVMGADGTKEIITVSKDSKTGGVKKTTSNDYNVGDIVTYSFNDDNEAKVTIRASAKMDGLTYTDGTKSITTKSITSPTVTTADCILFVQTDKDGKIKSAGEKTVADAEWSVYNIRDLDGITAAATAGKLSAVATNDDGKVVAAVIDLQADPDGATDDTVYGIVSSDPVRTANGYFSFKVQSNGEEYDILSEDKISKRTLVSFKPTANNKYKEGKIDQYKADGDFEAVYVDQYSVQDGTLSFFRAVGGPDGDGKYTKPAKADDIYALDKDCVIVYVDADGATSDAGSITSFDVYTGLKNAAIKTKAVEENGTTEYVITVIFAEVGGVRNVYAQYVDKQNK